VAARKRARRSAGDRGSRRRSDDREARSGNGKHREGGEGAERSHEHAGPRAFWSGTITFGLVSVPVDLYPAVRSRRAPLRMLGPQGQPLQRRYYCSADDEPLTNDDIVRGYEWPDGSFTVVTDDELDALAPRKSRDIDLQRFVGRGEIPPKLLERPYVLAPAGESTKAYRLLAQTMEQTGRAGIATFVMRGKEYLAAIFAEGGLLRAATMRFNDELRTPESIGLPRPPKADADERRSMELALAKLRADDIDRAALEDDYTSALLALAERKRSEGRDVVEVGEQVAEEEAESADVIDIMSVLKQRMGAARGPAAASAESRSSRREQEPRSSQREHDAPAAVGGRRASAKRASDDSLSRKSKKQLLEQAKKLNVENRSHMSKDELVAAIREAS
jgi:DNA end-binding protein Ku